MQDLINEYRGALEEAKRYKANLLKVRDAKKPLPPAPGQRNMRDSLDEDATLRIVNSMIDSLEYTIEYLELGHEPEPRRAIHRRANYQLEITTGNVEELRQWFFNEHGTAYEYEESGGFEISEWDKFKIDDAMSTLSEQERTTFLLKNRDCYSLSQIADKMDVSIRTVRSYLNRAEKKIDEQLNSSLFCVMS